MIRHVLMVKFKAEFPQTERQAWLDRVRGLPATVDSIRGLSAGFDTLGGDRSWDAAIVADFDDVDGLRSYATHPDHLPLLDISGPNSVQISSVDFELEAH
jgi:hypothetical protein